MTYYDMIELLFEWFPSLREKYIEEGDYIFEAPTLCYSFVFVPFIVKSCEDNDEDKLKRIGLFLEEMANCGDEMVEDLLVVGVLESVLPERNSVDILRAFLNKKTSEWLTLLEKDCGWAE